jgi:hypothetical protein
MHCTLLIPNLFPTYPGEAGIFDGLPLPALNILLARGQQKSSANGGMEEWLCRAFAVEKQQDWPIAPITLLADAGDPDQHYWLRADPVHLRVTRDHLILADSGTFAISQQEAEQLCNSLNLHFNNDGLVFYPQRPDRWYLRLATPPAMQTRPLGEVAGKHIDPFLPAGSDGMRWHTLYNEIQMLLHGHPINEQREARGEMPINSIWLWGGGTAPKETSTAYHHVWGSDSLALALAKISGTRCAPLPTSAENWLATDSGEKNHLIVLDTLRGAAQYDDIYGWREGIQNLERDWFAPLVTMLNQGKLTKLNLLAIEPNHSLEFSVTRGDLWKLWRRKKQFPAYKALT